MDKIPLFPTRIPSAFTGFFHELSSVRNLRTSLGILSLFALFTVIILMQQQLTTWHIENISVDPQKTYILLYRVPPWMESLQADEDCVVTTDERLLPSIEMFDAVVFSAETAVSHPVKRTADQFYVFSSRESPFYTNYKLFEEIQLFNLTMTYRRDSDIFWPSGSISNTKAQPKWEFEMPKWKDAVFEDGVGVKLTSLIAEKTKFSTWLSSECTDKSMRIDFISILENYIEIDIYGDCGRFDCPGTQEECLEMVERDYFFIFIGENSICRDFIGEFLFSAMRFFVIPVVFGGANYNTFLPPHSFIDANSFNRTTELADYLQRLAMDPSEYAKYFWWKPHYPHISSKRNYRGLCSAIRDFSAGKTSYLVRKYGEHLGAQRSVQTWWQEAVEKQCDEAPKIQII